MGSDGAHEGVGAQRALETILGASPAPDPDEGESAPAMFQRLVTMERPAEFDYSSCADWAASQILKWLLADPSRALLPVENVYKRYRDGRLAYNEEGGLIRLQDGWYDVMKKDGFDLSDLGLTGFMWGWAANAARRCVELPPVSNPAIVTITSE